MAERKVAATFGREILKLDPAWELDLAASLHDTHTPEGLRTLFDRFRGERGRSTS